MNELAIEPGDYVIDETWSQNENNRLLEDESGEPNPTLESTQHRALAELAASVHKYARHLSAEQTEQVIRWLKQWKLRGQPLLHSDGDPRRQSFLTALEQLRNNKEQKDLQRKAYLKTVWSRLWGVVFVLAVLATISAFATEDVGWGWRIGGVAISLILLFVSDAFLIQGVELYKEQDQRHLFQSFRKAETVAELRDAGLFAYIPEATYIQGQPFSNHSAKVAMRAEQERFSDALYRDPDYYLAKSSSDIFINLGYPHFVIEAAL